MLLAAQLERESAHRWQRSARARGLARARGAVVTMTSLDIAIRGLFDLGAKAVVFTRHAGNVAAYAVLPPPPGEADDDGIGAQALTADDAIVDLARALIAYRARRAETDAG
jgi:hypothetical protein